LRERGYIERGRKGEERRREVDRLHVTGTSFYVQWAWQLN